MSGVVPVVLSGLSALLSSGSSKIDEEECLL
jgi:hypothetical protein